MPQPAYKRCSRCGDKKPPEAFHRRAAAKDGRASHCKACASEVSREWNQRNAQRAATNKARWEADNRERVRAARKARPRNPKTEAANRRRRKERHPEKVRAREALGKAIYWGWLEKPDQCEQCGGTFSRAQIHGHHDDYAKPFEVRWLCRPCHEQLHRTEQKISST